MQTSGYGYNLPVGQAGQLVDLRDNTVESYAAEGAIGFGMGVTAGTAGDQVMIPDGAGDEFAGIALFNSACENCAVTGLAAYADHDAVPVLREGMAWVQVTSDVVAGANAYVDITNVDTTLRGHFTDVSTNNVPTNFKFRSAALSGHLAILEINLVGGSIVVDATTVAPTTEAPTTPVPTTTP